MWLVIFAFLGYVLLILCGVGCGGNTATAAPEELQAQVAALKEEVAALREEGAPPMGGEQQEGLLATDTAAAGGAEMTTSGGATQVPEEVEKTEVTPTPEPSQQVQVGTKVTENVSSVDLASAQEEEMGQEDRMTVVMDDASLHSRTGSRRSSEQLQHIEIVDEEELIDGQRQHIPRLPSGISYGSRDSFDSGQVLGVPGGVHFGASAFSEEDRLQEEIEEKTSQERMPYNRRQVTIGNIRIPPVENTSRFMTRTDVELLLEQRFGQVVESPSVEAEDTVQLARDHLALVSNQVSQQVSSQVKTMNSERIQVVKEYKKAVKELTAKVENLETYKQQLLQSYQQAVNRVRNELASAGQQNFNSVEEVANSNFQKVTALEVNVQERGEKVEKKFSAVNQRCDGLAENFASANTATATLIASLNDELKQLRERLEPLEIGLNTQKETLQLVEQYANQANRGHYRAHSSSMSEELSLNLDLNRNANIIESPNVVVGQAQVLQQKKALTNKTIVAKEEAKVDK